MPTTCPLIDVVNKPTSEWRLQIAQMPRTVLLANIPLILLAAHFAQGQHIFDVCQHHPRQDNKFAENRVLLDLVA